MKYLDSIGLTRLLTYLKQYIDDNKGVEESNAYIPVTYIELYEMKHDNELVPGTFYRITDYVTHTDQNGTESAGHQFDIIVLALTENTLSEEAWACQHDGDTYFNNSNLNAWKIWYCLDNDTSRFGWVLHNYVINLSSGGAYYRTPENDGVFIGGVYRTHKACAFKSDDGAIIYVYKGHLTGTIHTCFGSLSGVTSVGSANITDVKAGVIYRMIDEYGNDCPYDFKNIKFSLSGDWVSENRNWLEQQGVVLPASDQSYVCYTFTGQPIVQTTAPGGTGVITYDGSIAGDDSGPNKCYNNIITSKTEFDSSSNGKLKLPGNIILCSSNTTCNKLINCENVVIGQNCRNNTVIGLESENDYSDPIGPNVSNSIIGRNSNGDVKIGNVFDLIE